MVAKYILGILGAVFLLLGIAHVMKAGARIEPAARAWLSVGVIFCLVAVWLWLQ